MSKVMLSPIFVLNVTHFQSLDSRLPGDADPNTATRHHDAFEFYALGLGEVYAVSALLEATLAAHDGV